MTRKYTATTAVATERNGVPLNRRTTGAVLTSGTVAAALNPTVDGSRSGRWSGGQLHEMVENGLVGISQQMTEADLQTVTQQLESGR